MVLLSHDAFLVALKSLFDAQATSSVFLTHKRVAARGGDPVVVLYRATNGKGRRVATRVDAERAKRFHEALMNVVKGSMAALKKVEKTKDQKAAERAAAAKRAVPIGGDLD
jgi:hypothetical protein